MTVVDIVSPVQPERKGIRTKRTQEVGALAGLLAYAQQEAVSLRRKNTAKLIEAALVSLLMPRSTVTEVIALQREQDDAGRIA